MTREDVKDIKIEGRGMPRYWNITMLVDPKPGNPGTVPCFRELVVLASNILIDAKGFDPAEGWVVSNAEVMAWSNRKNRGVTNPFRYRVTLDLCDEEGGTK